MPTSTSSAPDSLHVPDKHPEVSAQPAHLQRPLEQIIARSVPDLGQCCSAAWAQLVCEAAEAWQRSLPRSMLSNWASSTAAPPCKGVAGGLAPPSRRRLLPCGPTQVVHACFRSTAIARAWIDHPTKLPSNSNHIPPQMHRMQCWTAPPSAAGALPRSWRRRPAEP